MISLPDRFRILFEIVSVFLFIFACLRIRYEVGRCFPGATLRHTVSSIGSHFWAGLKTGTKWESKIKKIAAFRGWKLYRYIIPLYLLLLIFPLIVNFVYAHSLPTSTLVSVPPLGLLAFTAVSSTLAWVKHRNIFFIKFPQDIEFCAFDCRTAKWSTWTPFFTPLFLDITYILDRRIYFCG